MVEGEEVGGCIKERVRGRGRASEEGGTRRGRRGMGLKKGRSVNEGKEKGGMQRVFFLCLSMSLSLSLSVSYFISCLLVQSEREGNFCKFIKGNAGPFVFSRSQLDDP